MSQLIELLWRNTAYEDAIKAPNIRFANRKGAMFAGFDTEMSFDSTSKTVTKKFRQEAMSYDRICVYPGKVVDSQHDYNIGPLGGVDPASLDLPMAMQMPRTVETERFSADLQVDYANAQLLADRPSTTNDNQMGIADPNVVGGAPNAQQQTGGFSQAAEYYQASCATGNGPKGWPDKKDPEQRDSGKPNYLVPPGMMIRKRTRHGTDSSIVSDNYAQLAFADDMNFNSAGETKVLMDLDNNVTGVGCVLKKIVVQCSKEHHHISEISLDFSDITRSSGSISSNENPQANILTILMDGKTKLHEAYYDVKMGKFASNKFHLGLSSVRYFPPLASPAGGFDAGSQVAVPDTLTFNCERLGVDSSLDAAVSVSNQGYVDRGPGDSFPNPLRGTAAKLTNNDTTRDQYGPTGARNVADAVNMGYQMESAAHGEVGNPNYVKGKFDVEAPPANRVTMHTAGDNLVTNDFGAVGQLVPEVRRPQVNWKMSGASSYTFKPRETRGTILAVTVIMQADPSAY